MQIRYPTILFFQVGAVTTPAETLAADKYGPNVRFRNASMVPNELSPGSIEKHDGVAGTIPAPYRGCKSGEQAMAEFNALREQRAFDFQAASAKEAAKAATVGTAPVPPAAKPPTAETRTGQENMKPVQPTQPVAPPTDVAQAALAAGWPIGAKPQ